MPFARIKPYAQKERDNMNMVKHSVCMAPHFRAARRAVIVPTRSITYTGDRALPHVAAGCFERKNS